MCVWCWGSFSRVHAWGKTYKHYFGVVEASAWWVDKNQLYGTYKIKMKNIRFGGIGFAILRSKIQKEIGFVVFSHWDYDTLREDMCGMLLGIDMTWKLGIESDSKILANMENADDNNTSIVTPTLIRRKFLNLDWQVDVIHTLRERNRWEDWLVNHN